MTLEKQIQSLQKDIFFFTTFTFENWDFTNPITKGIGGSETSQIEMSSRLARRGHNVISYAPVPWDDEFKIHRDVKWISHEKVTFTENGLWIIYRIPEALDEFSIDHLKEGKEVWFVAQDVFYEAMNEERFSKIDKYICLCQDHANYVSFKYPQFADKIVISSNGINVDIINALVKNNKIERNPHRLIYSSSPDRGLEQLIPIFQKAKEFIPDLELHVYYGFDNIDKVIAKMPFVARMKDSIMAGMNSTDGIFWHGRVGQIELLIEWMKSGIWCYPINFTETSCISCMEAQACGVIPIVSPVWALRENVMHGIQVQGDVKDKLTLAKFVGEIVRVCNSQDLRDKLLANGKMIEEAKVRFNWERYVDQWESWIFQPACTYFFCQYAFQQKFAFGKILNIGCDTDASKFSTLRNAINLDVMPHDNVPVDIIGNILDESSIKLITDENDKGDFDTVIVGDMLEHMNYIQGVNALKNASFAMKYESGKGESLMIITCPSDPRPREVQNPTMKGDEIYPGGISQFHRLIKEAELMDMIKEAGLTVIGIQDIDYTHFHGFGVLCTLGGE
jgi:glycosyltransferase involved in cell wall biosynthesis